MKYSIIIILIFTLFTSNVFSQANAGDDQEICTNHTYLEALHPDVGFSGKWSIIGGSCNFDDETLCNTEITDVNTGSLKLLWTVTNGVSTTTDEITVVNNTPTNAQLPADIKICENYHTVSANAYSNDETGKWTVTGGTGNFDDNTSPVVNITNISEDANTYRWTIKKSICSSFDEIIITNNHIETSVGNDQTICVSNTTITAQEPVKGTGHWQVTATSGSPVVTTPNNFTTTVTGLGYDSNTILWTLDYENCSVNAAIHIVNNSVTPANAGQDQITCDNFTNLAGNNPVHGNGHWSVVSGNGNFEYLENYNTKVTDLNHEENIFKWKITKHACSSESEVSVYYDYYEAVAGDDAEICSNTYTLQATEPATGYSGKWTVTGGSGSFDNDEMFNATVSGLQKGNNTLQWKVIHGNCEHTDYLIISNDTPTNASTLSDKEICSDNTNISGNAPQVGEGTWSVTQGTGTFSALSYYNTDVSNVGLNENIYRWTIKNKTCSSYDEISVTNNYTTASAENDKEICGTTTTITGSQPGTSEYGTWSRIDGAGDIISPNNYTTNIINVGEGSNKFRWTIKKGICDASDDVIVTNNKYTAIASIGGPSEICNDYTSISGSNPPSGGYGLWTVESGNGVFDNNQYQTTYVRQLAEGSNTIRWSVYKGSCSAYDEVEIIRHNVIANAGADQIVCNANATMNADALETGTTGEWYLLTGYGVISNNSDPKATVSGLIHGATSFKWTVTGFGCESTDDVTISNNEFLNSAGTNQHICEGNTTLNGSNPFPGTGVWTVIEGGGIFANKSLRNTDVTNLPDLTTSKFRWTVNKDGCTDYDDVLIYNEGVTAHAGADQILCINNTTITASDPYPASGVWQLTNGGGTVTNPDSPQTIVTNLAAGQSTLVWTVTYNSCSSSDNLIITNNSVFASAGTDKEVCYDYAQLLADMPPAGGYGVWSVTEGTGNFDNVNLYNTYVRNMQRGVNKFKWTMYNNDCNSGGDEVIVTNNNFDADAGVDQILPQFVTATTMDAVLPAGGSGTWEITAGTGTIISPNEYDTDITAMETGVNTFKWTVENNNCIDYDLVNITVANFAVSAGPDTIICKDSLMLTPEIGAFHTTEWSIIQGSGIIENPNETNAYVKNLSQGENILRWTVSLNGAYVHDDVTITSGYANAGNDKSTYNEQTTLNAEALPNGFTGTWSVVFGEGVFDNINSPNSVVSDIALGINQYRWTVTHPQCSGHDDVVISHWGVNVEDVDDDVLISPNPNNGNFFLNTTGYKNSYIQISDITGKVKYKGVIETNKTSISLKPINSGVYFITIYSKDKQITEKLIVK